MNKLIVFDLDGTLLDSLPDIAACANKVLQSNGLPTHQPDAYRGFIGEGTEKIIMRATEGLQLGGLTVQELIRQYKQEYAINYNVHSRVYPGIMQVLDQLQQQHYKLCVLSNKNHEFTQKCVDHYEAWLRAEVGKRERWLDYLWSASSLTLAKDRQLGIPRQTWRRHGTTGLLGEE